MNGQNDESCRNAILSNSYADFLLRKERYTAIRERYPNSCIQVINDNYVVFHLFIDNPEEYQNYNYYYSIFPKLYGLMDTSNLEDIGVKRLRRLSYLNLYGQGTIIGFVDTGIDYRLDVFKNADNTTRIRYIWDQTIQTGRTPEGMLYGSEYTSSMINEALKSENPLDIVPSTDTNGHGSFMAGVAAGNIDISNDFSGVAPQADIVVVKLKPAKQNIRDYYYIREDAVSFQENDIILGIKYIIEKSILEQKPAIICLGLGTNSGGHDGYGILDDYLNTISNRVGVCVVAPTGNESNYAGHYRGNGENIEEYEDVELRVGEGNRGFALELWAKAPSVYSIALISPSGELVERIPAKFSNSQIVRFLFESTVVYVDYRILEVLSGDELIFMRFSNPSPGIWTIRVYKDNSFNNVYDIWLPINEFIAPDTYFIKPDPNVTITGPGNTETVITTAGYNHVNQSIFLNSGRGYTRSGRIKPIIAAPAVNITGPLLNNTFGTRTGTSIAAAQAAGAASLLFQWGIVDKNREEMDYKDIRSLFIKGATRQNIQYPNNEWGYGALNVFEAFNSLRSTI